MAEVQRTHYVGDDCEGGHKIDHQDEVVWLSYAREVLWRASYQHGTKRPMPDVPIEAMKYWIEVTCPLDLEAE